MTSEDRREFLQFLGEHDTPAFIRRAQGVADAWKAVLQECERKRDELLDMPRMRLGVLAETISHEWNELGKTFLDATVAESLQALHAEWQPVLRVPVQPVPESSRWSRVVDELIVAFERFNRRWEECVKEFNLSHVNALREGYNKYYVIEKSCAFDSDRIGAEGFEELQPATAACILKELPPLPIPKQR